LIRFGAFSGRAVAAFRRVGKVRRPD
jgi:hypothetical protein